MPDNEPHALDALAIVWQARGLDPAWFKTGYEEAAARVTHETNSAGSFWYSPNDDSSAERGDVISELGEIESPADVRARAFELLVLADLAEHAS